MSSQLDLKASYGWPYAAVVRFYITQQINSIEKCVAEKKKSEIKRTKRSGEGTPTTSTTITKREMAHRSVASLIASIDRNMLMHAIGVFSVGLSYAH